LLKNRLAPAAGQGKAALFQHLNGLQENDMRRLTTRDALQTISGVKVWQETWCEWMR
jgi:hypothetical protein